MTDGYSTTEPRRTPRVILNLRIHPASLATIDQLAHQYRLTRSIVARTMLATSDRAALTRALAKIGKPRPEGWKP